MKISFSTLACPDWNLDKIIKFAVDNSYDGVELRGKEPHISVNYNKQKRKEIKNKFKENNLEIPCITAYTRFNNENSKIRKENINNLKEMIDLASDLGAKYVRTFGSEADSPYTVEQLINWIREAFEEVDSYAKEKEVKVLLETHDVLSKGEDLIKIFEKSSIENCGILWDVAHSIRAGENINQTLNFLEEYIYHVHVKDWINLTYKNEDHYVLLGAGELKIEKLLTGLKEINYDGYLSLEWEKMWHPEIEEADIAIIQYSQKINEYIK